MCYLTREAVELVLNEDSYLEDFFDSDSEENVVDSGEEFVPVDLEADLSDSGKVIFIFIIGIHATSVIKHFRGMWYDYGLFIWQVHILSFLKMCLLCYS